MDETENLEHHVPAPGVYLRESIEDLLRTDGFALTERVLTIPEHSVQTLDLEKLRITTDDDGSQSCQLEKPETCDLAYRREWLFLLPSGLVTGFEVAVPYTDEEKMLLTTHDNAFKTWIESVEKLTEQGVLSVDDALESLNRSLEKAISNIQELLRAVELGYIASSEDSKQNFRERVMFMNKGLDAALPESTIDDTRFSTPVMSEDEEQYRLNFIRLVHSFKDIFNIRAEVLKRAMTETAENHRPVREGERGVLSPVQAWRVLSQLDKCRDF